jgi:predicted nucleic acid-binding protein
VFSAALDTCVLVPSMTRDVLLEIAERGVYRPVWSIAILDELADTLHKLSDKRGTDHQTAQTYVRRLRDQMATAFPDAMVTGWEHLVEGIKLPDQDDRHVVAAAVAGRADVIVTDNVKDFPPFSLPGDLSTQTADEFLVDSLDLQPEAVNAAVARVAQRTGRTGPAMTNDDVLDRLSRSGAVNFVNDLRRRRE